MYQDFSIVTIDTNLKDKSVVITANFDVDPETVTDSNIVLLDRLMRNEVEYSASVEGTVITLSLLEWPTPNVEYILRIQNLKTVLGDSLSSGIRRKVIFKSAICSKAKIIYPAFDEVITDLRLEWQEILVNPTDMYVNSYYIEISTENAFNNLLKHVEVTANTSIDLTDLPKGQYYVRIRVQDSLGYGEWSEVITFVVADHSMPPEPPIDPDDDDVIYIPEMNITSSVDNGITPAYILIELDHDIDPASIANIIVTRRPL
jgi:hypothetical protein